MSVSELGGEAEAGDGAETRLHVALGPSGDYPDDVGGVGGEGAEAFGPALEALLAGAEDLGEDDVIGRGQFAGKISSEIAGARIEVRLEYRDDPAAALAGGGQHCCQFGRMVRIVIDD